MLIAFAKIGKSGFMCRDTDTNNNVFVSKSDIRSGSISVSNILAQNGKIVGTDFNIIMLPEYESGSNIIYIYDVDKNSLNNEVLGYNYINEKGRIGYTPRELFGKHRKNGILNMKMYEAIVS